jgi:hypothetical protein
MHGPLNVKLTYFVVGTLGCPGLFLFINSGIVGFCVLFIRFNANCLRMATRTDRDMPQSITEYNKRRIFVQNI